MAIKPITNKQIVSKESVNRANQVSTKDISAKPNIRSENAAVSYSPGSDFTKNYAVTLKDIDTSVMGFVKEIIRPTIKENNEVFKVPILYANQERWVSARKQGVLRDKNGALILPLIMMKRTEVAKSMELPVGMEHDLKREDNNYVVGTTWSKTNRYDRFAVQQGKKPITEFLVTTVPNYVNITYEFMLWSNFIEQMNTLTENFMEFNNQYWGTGEEKKFYSLVESIADNTEMDQAGQRFIKSSFSVTTKAYLLPEDYNSIVTNKISTLQKNRSVGSISFSETLLD
jgi:hypothetical protein|tara:strand:- start:620 stop:1477 length:858 start_codon:yes stop_codon:yes gene_type:complete